MPRGSASSWTQSLALAVVPRLVSVSLGLIGRTLRFEEISEPGSLPDENSDVNIYCFWHRCLLLAAWFYHRRKIAILISQSFDGELIARTVERLGFEPVRGSSSRGGAAGLLAMQDALARVDYAAFTSDGPRGPVYVAKPGAVKLAQLTGGRVGTFYLLPVNAWTLNSWDRFLIPKPFSRVIVSWARPVSVAQANEGEDALEQLQDAMERARLAAQACAAEGRRGRPRGIYDARRRGEQEL